MTKIHIPSIQSSTRILNTNICYAVTMKYQCGRYISIWQLVLEISSNGIETITRFPNIQYQYPIISVVATASTSTVLLKFLYTLCQFFVLLTAISYFLLQKPFNYQNVQHFNNMMAISMRFSTLQSF